MAPSLPPALKQLLKAPTFVARPSKLRPGATLPAGRPAGPLAAPAGADLQRLFARIASEASKRKIKWEEWGCVATAVMITLNSPNSLQALHRYSAPADLALAERVHRACLMRETGLKCIGFIGIPKVINNLAALRAAVEEDAELAKALPTEPRRHITPESLPGVHKAANELWDDIYQPHSRKLVSILGTSHPDLPVFIIEGEYGPLFSTPSSFSATSAKQEEPAWEVGRLRTSLVAIAALRAQGGVGPQVTSHAWGLIKAAPAVEEGEEGKKWLTTEEGVSWIVKTVDGICEAVEGAEHAEARESKL